VVDAGPMCRKYVFAFVAVLIACNDAPPPCHPDGAPEIPIPGPTPDPLPGPGGPGVPPDHQDAPDKYSKNEEGEVCTCGPYAIGCTTDPDGVPGDEAGTVSSPPSDDCNASGQCGGPAIGDFSRSTFNFVTIVAYDGTSEAGGWQEAFAKLKFRRFKRFSLIPEVWTCPLKIGMPLRARLYGTISHDRAATITVEIAEEATHIVQHEMGAPPPGIFCIQLKPVMERLFGERYPDLGQKINR
jgi:hypothetical protein